jgi:hypothetical protein
MKEFWSDEFDADLLKVVPGIEKQMGDTAETKLWTYCTVPYKGRINLPVVWNCRDGMNCFVWTTPPDHKRDEFGWFEFGRGNYTSRAPLVECTWLELVRDLWVHDQGCILDEQTIIWRDRQAHVPMMALMYDVRNNPQLSEAVRAHHIRIAGDMVFVATEILREHSQRRR